MKNNIIGEIYWDTPETLKNRIFLICIKGKCMSGKIEKYNVLDEPLKIQIEVSFIDPPYFENEIELGNRFTIQEASKVLAEGIITGNVV